MINFGDNIWKIVRKVSSGKFNFSETIKAVIAQENAFPTKRVKRLK